MKFSVDDLCFCANVVRDMYNLQDARSQYNLSSGAYVPNGDAFTKYSPAYLVANEDVRLAMQKLSPMGMDVLTVAASGDQPMFYKIFGAAHVDTFDISYNAKIIMDIKTAAVQKLSWHKFKNFMHGLNSYRSVLDAPEYAQVVSLCSPHVRKYVQKMHGMDYYMRGGVLVDELPTKREYDVLQNCIDKPFNFIWTDVDSLHAKLNKKYNQIYLSNILQYGCQFDRIEKLVCNLKPFLKADGVIMLQVSPYFVMDELAVYDKLKRVVDAWADIKMVNTRTHYMCMLVRKL